MTPCVGICKLEDDICIGCNRTMEEIKEAYEKTTMPRVRLLSEKQVKQVNKYLNSQKRLQRKRQDLLETKDILTTLGH